MIRFCCSRLIGDDWGLGSKPYTLKRLSGLHRATWCRVPGVGQYPRDIRKLGLSKSLGSLAGV